MLAKSGELDASSSTQFKRPKPVSHTFKPLEVGSYLHISSDFGTTTQMRSKSKGRTFDTPNLSQTRLKHLELIKYVENRNRSKAEKNRQLSTPLPPVKPTFRIKGGPSWNPKESMPKAKKPKEEELPGYLVIACNAVRNGEREQL